MAANRKVISFFLASPGDLAVERKIAKQVADELNSMLSLKFNVHIELVGWEDTVSSAGRPQEIINRDLERCDVFIGILWKRWGSAPDNESKYESGFEEEFTIATTSHKQARKPLISLFFKKVDSPALSDPGEQLQKVIRFKKKIIEEKTLLFQEFETKEDFETAIRKCMSSYALEHVDLSESKPQETHTPDANSAPINNDQDNDAYAFSPIQGKSANFINSILHRTGDAEERARLEPFEVARLRLISSSLGDGQNDTIYLGAHDANLIYRNKDSCSLDGLELLKLLQSGAKNIPQENIPFWYWLQHRNNNHYNLAFLTLTISESNYAIVNSILDLMTLTGTDIHQDELFSRRDYIQNWLSEKKNFTIRNAALRYLIDKGDESDLADIQNEIDKNSSQTITLACEAYIAIRLRSGVSAGMNAVIDLQPSVISTEVIDTLFKQPGHITTEDLYKAIENRNKIVRERAIQVLTSRDLLSPELTQTIQQDPEPSIRALAIPALLKKGAILSEEEAKAIVMKDSSKPTTDENAIWPLYQSEILAAMDSSELERKASKLLPIVSDAYFELSRRHIEARRAELTNNLTDNYQSFYSNHLNLWAESTNSTPESVHEQFEALKDYIINKLIRKTITILVEKKSKKDLPIIRQSLANQLIRPIEADLKYMQLHGEWQDIPLIIDITKRFSSSEANSLLGSSNISKSVCTLAVKTLLKIGKDRIADILSLECPSVLKRNIISSISDKEFIAIGEDVILEFLNNDDAEIRKHCALKCAKTYPKKRLTSLLDRYSKSEQEFYNVIHWIDFGTYASKEQIKNACKKIFIA
ncbi:DUF4062 domain-containing protein [Pseudomonas sp. microsymbiont 2]